MTDRPAPHPRPAAGRHPRGRRDESPATLEFSKWYDTPIFEVEREERLEELATTGRGPRRLVAAAMLAADSRRAHRLERRGRQPAIATEPVDPPATAAPPPRVAKPATPKAVPPPAPARTPHVPAQAPAPTPPAPKAAAPAPTPPARKTATRRPARRRAAARAAREVTADRLLRARATHQARMLEAPLDPVQRVADDEAWERWASTEPELGGHEDLARLDEEARAPGRLARRVGAVPTEAKASLRQRVSRGLDRLAERELDRSARLEQAVVPKLPIAFAAPGRRRSKAS